MENWRICEQTKLFNYFMFKNEIKLKIKSDERFLAKWRIHKIGRGNHVWELRLKRTFFNRQRGKSYKLYYFRARGRGEFIRLAFLIAGVEFEDFCVDIEKDWPAFKASK